MSITVIKAGVYDTIQDEGRKGHAAFGINPSGVMDVLAMQAANALAGNELSTAVIEMLFPAPVMQFNSHAIVGLSGAEFDAVITDTSGNIAPFSNNRTAYVAAGSVLSFNRKISGERCYLAVHTGFDLPRWFGSISTNSKIKEGGYKGRRLLKDDAIPFAIYQPMKAHTTSTVFPWFAHVQSWYDGPSIFNILPGPEWDWLDGNSQKSFLREGFTITAQSDRMGITLKGLPLSINRNEQLLSSGVSYGTIQLLPDGQMIILAADHPTTGGYPRIGNIISAHLPKLAQASPGHTIKFLPTTIAHAEDMLLLQHKEMQRLKGAMKLRLATI